MASGASEFDHTETDQELRRILERAETVAVVGIKDRPSEDAFRIPKYLKDNGYTIIPVNPKVRKVLGEPAFPTLAEVDRDIDLVDLFRAADNIPAHVDEILELSHKPAAVWMQLGIHHGPAAKRLRDAGIEVVQDLCIMVEHRRLITGDR